MKQKLFSDNNLIHAIVNCDYDAVSRILQIGDYDKSCLDDIGGFLKEVPLFILSVCYSIILNPEDYSNNMPSFLKEKYEENKKILSLFEKYFGFKNDNIIIEDFVQDFYETEEDFSEESEQAKTFEEFCASAVFNKYKFQNFREIDLRLYYAVWELRSYYEIKKCCEAGANPDFALPDQESPLEYIAHDISHLETEVYKLLKEQKTFDIWNIVDLTWCARHQQNYNLLLQAKA